MSGAFVGRQDQLAYLTRILTKVQAGQPRIVLIEGPPGIGKTALIQRFLTGAVRGSGATPPIVDDLRILQSSGEETEAVLAYGIIEQLVLSTPLPLPAGLTALGPRSPPSLEPVTVGAGLVGLLSSLQGHGPVVIVIDDVHWADTPSLQAVLYALRRLHAARVLALFATRDNGTACLPEGLRKLFSSERGDRLLLAGLEAAELQQLGDALACSGLSPQLAKRLREHTGGNPLYVRALLEELPLKMLRSAEVLLPAPRSFSTLVRSRLATCPPNAQRLVAAASVLGVQCPLGLACRLARIDDPLLAVEQAMAARLLRISDCGSGRGIAFLHPLVRAAIYHDLGPACRAGLHTQAAELVEDRASSLRHRVAAAPAEDEVLAVELTAYAQKEAAQGSWASAAASLFSASRLSPARADREHRLLEGVECLLNAGDIHEAAAYADTITTFAHGAHRGYVLGRLALFTARMSEAEELLRNAWESCDPTSERELGAKIAWELALLYVVALRGTDVVTWTRRVPQGTALASHGLSTLVHGLIYAGQATEAIALVRSVSDPLGEPQPADLDGLFARGTVRLMSDDLTGAQADLFVAWTGHRRWGPLWFAIAALTFLALTEYRLGAWDDAIVHAQQAASTAEDADQVFLMSLAHAVLAAPLAGRGEWELAAAHVQTATTVAEATGIPSLAAIAAIAQAQLARAQGDHDSAVAAMQPLLHLPDREGLREPGWWYPWQELHADALVSLGRFDEAERILAPFEALAADRGRRSAMANAARIQGSLQAARGRAAEAKAAFIAGLRHADAVSIPFDRALLEAAYGRFLRRANQRRAAAAQLHAARERFARLGALPFQERCSRELTACGLTPAKRKGRDPARLTPQELSVARLVASGLRNREVSAELMVSVNTVEFHLKNVYTKLGITSRSQLAMHLTKL